MTRDEFIAIFPEFTSTPTSRVTFWLNYSSTFVPVSWGTSYTTGLALLTAHNLTIQANGLTGLDTSMSVGPASVGTDYSLTLDGLAKHYNMSMYGVMFYELFKLKGYGVSQIMP
jgi:hypothetical protein